MTLNIYRYNNNINGFILFMFFDKKYKHIACSA